jgi:plasmid stabilization system protein ParE
MSKFYLTRRANTELFAIESYSIEQWGEKRAAQYMGDIYGALKRISQIPEIGQVHFHSSMPFLMAPAEQHFAIYKAFKKGILIATILHGRRNIEAIIRDMAPALEAEINEIEKRTSKNSEK